MKRRDLIRLVESFGWVLLRHEPKHDIYHNPATGMTPPIPRHQEMNELLAKKLVRDLSSEKE
jgi:predicted RNA binding protein YcfA (HicA-like mRNA interferase family)